MSEHHYIFIGVYESAAEYAKEAYLGELACIVPNEPESGIDPLDHLNWSSFAASLEMLGKIRLNPCDAGAGVEVYVR